MTSVEATGLTPPDDFFDTEPSNEDDFAPTRWPIDDRDGTLESDQSSAPKLDSRR